MFTFIGVFCAVQFLVYLKGSLADEGFAALPTLVGPRPGVGYHVPLERGQGEEGFAALLTLPIHVLSVMDFHMDPKRTLTAKRFATRFTLVRSFFGVSPHVSAQRTGTIEGLPTFLAFIASLSSRNAFLALTNFGSACIQTRRASFILGVPFFVCLR